MADDDYQVEEMALFRERLLAYRRALAAGDREKVAHVRSDLNVLWGSIKSSYGLVSDQSRYERDGKRFDVMESVLNPEFHEPVPDLRLVDLAQQSIERAIGTANRRTREWAETYERLYGAGVRQDKQPASSERRQLERFLREVAPFAGRAALLLGALALNEFSGASKAAHGWLVTSSPLVKVVVGAVAAVVTGVFTNLLSSIIHEDGWRGGWQKHRLLVSFYFLLIVISALTLALLTWPSTPAHS